jgi:hypothetical protein
LLERNSNLREALHQHLVPSELIDGTYDELYEVFLDDRGKEMMSVLEEKIFKVRKEFLQEANLHQ